MRRKNIGTGLIVLSILLLLFIYYPFISAYFGTSTPVQITSTGSFISIPKINATAPIIEQVDPWNRQEYEEALKKGVAKAKGFENFYFAHSSLEPWEMTRVNTAFLRLGELKIDDIILIYQDGKETRYKVFDKKEIWPNQIDALNSSEPSVLILQTCIPLGTDLKRLLVFAKPI